MDIKQLKKDFSEIISDFPNLMLVLRDNCYYIEGTIDFTAFYKNYPTISDKYEIQMTLKNYPDEVPSVTEVGNRIKRDIDNHISDDGQLCLGSKLSCYEIFDKNLQSYFKNLLIPFLYANSYKEKNGHYPWKPLNHGISGVLEYYKERFSLNDQEILTLFRNIDSFYKTKGHHICLCGRQEKFRKCCREKLRPIIGNPNTYNIFKKDIESINVDLEKIRKQNDFVNCLKNKQ